MKNAGKHFFASKPIVYYDSSIGRLAIYSISLSHNLKLLKALGGNLASCDPMHFVKNLLLYICYPANALGEKQAKPNEIVLSAEDVGKLADEEIDKIAELYVEHDPYLYRKLISETKTAEDGKQVTSFRYGEVEHPKEDGESNIQYLHRLYVIYEKKQKEQMARLTKSILGPAHFSSQAFKGIEETLSMGNSIAKLIEATRFPSISDSLARAVESMKIPPMGDSMSILAESMSKLRPTESVLAGLNAGVAQEVRPVEITPILPKIDIEGLAESAAKAKWAPFEFLAKRIDNMTEVSSKSATFMVEMNKTQTTIASEIKASGEQATRSSQQNILFTKIIIVLAVISLLVAAYGLAFNRRSDDSGLHAILEQLRQERADFNSRQDTMMVEYQKNVERLQKEQETDRQTIEQLRARILELENQLKSNGHATTPAGDE